MSLAGAASATATTDGSGTYQFTGLANGSYTVTPDLSGYSFSPSALTVTLSGADLTGQSFTSQTASRTYKVSGTVSGVVAAGVTVSLTGDATATKTTDASGSFQFTGLSNGTYSLAASLTGYVFIPKTLTVTVNGADVTGQSFTDSAAPACPVDCTASGRVCNKEWGICVSASCTGQPDFTPCNSDALTPTLHINLAYDICVNGQCVSPGTCPDTSCNAPGPHFPLPDTGQNRCFDTTLVMASCPTSKSDDFYGQDAQYGWDVTNPMSARFEVTDTGGRVVADKVTGLEWEGCVQGHGGCGNAQATALCTSPDGQCKWEEALAYCDALDWGGHQDWRLPDVYELSSVVDSSDETRDQGRSMDPVAFPEMVFLGYLTFWSSSSNAGDASQAWTTELNQGATSIGPKSDIHPVRCVRGGSAVQGPRFARSEAIAGQPTVTDAWTNREWQGCVNGQDGTQHRCPNLSLNRVSWQKALATCSLLDWGGHTDWRLPNRMELQSLMDDRVINPSADTVAFPELADIPADSYGRVWFNSSTSFPSSFMLGGSPYSFQWMMELKSGTVSLQFKEAPERYYARCVRAGP